MMFELARALVCTLFMVVGCYGAIRADWKILRFLMALFVVAVMAGEVFEAVNAASTMPDDIGTARKVGWFTIAAGILAVWRGPAWLSGKTDGHA